MHNQHGDKCDLCREHTAVVSTDVHVVQRQTTPVLACDSCLHRTIEEPTGVFERVIEHNPQFLNLTTDRYHFVAGENRQRVTSVTRTCGDLVWCLLLIAGVIIVAATTTYLMCRRKPSAPKLPKVSAIPILVPGRQ